MARSIRCPRRRRWRIRVALVLGREPSRSSGCSDVLKTRRRRRIGPRHSYRLVMLRNSLRRRSLVICVAMVAVLAGCAGSGRLSSASVEARCSQALRNVQGAEAGGISSQTEVTVARLRSALTYAHRAIPSFIRAASGDDYLAVCRVTPLGAPTTVCPSGDRVHVGELVRVVDSKGRIVTLPNEAMLYPEIPLLGPCDGFEHRP